MIVDWFSWTYDLPGREVVPFKAIETVRVLNAMTLANLPDIINRQALVPATSVPKGFHSAWLLPGVGTLASSRMRYARVELTGQGCEHARQAGALDDLIARHGDRCTRLDLAVDTRIDQTPIETGEGSKSLTGTFSTRTGETAYFHSKKSDVSAKVYRYNAPHPRHETTRFEVTYRRAAARRVCAALASGESTIGDCLLDRAARAGIGVLSAFQPALIGQAENAPKTSQKATRNASTIRWLHEQVLPALEKVHDDPDFDRAAYLAKVREALAL